ncbi:MAG TPA: Glu/Leu/Phe/Val dehydrogenase dimerization domain-containing protein, partial [Sandaracinaceae bacterium]
MSVFEHPDFEHAEVAFIEDRKAGLNAIVAIHRRGRLGTAGGGCRMWPYRSSDDALTDALRLSRAMSYKLALFELPAGGAKVVIPGDPKRDKSPRLLEALGRAVERYGGRLVVAEDIGITRADLEIVARETRYVVRDGSTAEPTARGVLACLRESLRRRLGGAELRGASVAVQGLGAVGWALCEELAREGARLVVADLDEERAQRAVDRFGARREDPHRIHAALVDAFAPCALGVLDEQTIPELRCAVVVGSANAPLANDACADALAARGVLFVPDFVASAGAVLAAAGL